MVRCTLVILHAQTDFMIEKCMDLPFVPTKGMTFALPYFAVEPDGEAELLVASVSIHGVTGEVRVNLDDGSLSVEDMKEIVDADPGWKVVLE